MKLGLRPLLLMSGVLISCLDNSIASSLTQTAKPPANAPQDRPTEARGKSEIDEYQAAIGVEISKRSYDRAMIKRDVPLSNNSGQHCGVIYKVRAWEMRKIKYAFVDVNPGQLSSYNLPLMFARQYGIEVEVFSDIPSAEQWLLRDQS